MSIKKLGATAVVRVVQVDEEEDLDLEKNLQTLKNSLTAFPRAESILETYLPI
jgi:hypothetical protein